MNFRCLSHRNGETIANDSEFSNEWTEIKEVLTGITDEDLITEFESRTRVEKSISLTINKLIKERLVAKSWAEESPIFQSKEHTSGKWRLDFAKGKISVEVAFNHGEATAWNLLKPSLASEYNYIDKAIQTKLGIVIFATQKMKKAGGFDNAVGTLEKAETYLKPMYSLLPCPMIIIGLEEPESFVIEHKKDGNRKVGHVVKNYF
uniref:Restriction endonuclease BglII n=1 Tax=uncultured marine group II/III euryarchaeote AD1000_65_H04 TaxID=1457796 RepID=A0A075FVV4_9EURY|nr:hypothetical protein [uncultured marine group II/III euryarchaeote AD1000_65_H04]